MAQFLRTSDEEAAAAGLFVPPAGASAAEALLAYAANKRRLLANGAAVIDVGERTIPTWVDPESRGAIMGLRDATEIIPELTATWKGADGEFYVLTTAEIVALALGMMQFVQSCFDAEAAVAAAIAGETITTTAEVDASTWPSSS